MTYGDVKGDASDAAHKNWIHLESCDFGVIRNVTQESGNPKRNVGTPAISKIKISKRMDSATPGAFLESLTGIINLLINKWRLWFKQWKI